MLNLHNILKYIAIVLFVLEIRIAANPLKISRYINFSYTESLNYSSNLFLADNENGALSLVHSLSAIHAQKRPWYNYTLGYSISYRQFLDNSNEDFFSQGAFVSISIPRKDYEISFGTSFDVTSEPLNIEFENFVVSYVNNYQISGIWDVTPVFRINMENNYQSVRFPDNEEEDVDTIVTSLNAIYQINNQVDFTAGTTYNIVAGDEREAFRGIGIGLNYKSKFPLVYWIDQVSMRFGFTLDGRFKNPLLFNFTISGTLNSNTSWSITGNRDVTFSIVDSFQIESKISLELQYTINPYVRVTWFGTFTHTELENRNSLFSAITGLSIGYAITAWTSVGAQYSFATRDNGNEVFYEQSVSANWTIRF